MSRGRPRKSEAEKKERQKNYWQKYKNRMTDEQKEKRKNTSRRCHDRWIKTHKKEWAEYMRDYRKKRKEKDEQNK